MQCRMISDACILNILVCLRVFYITDEHLQAKFNGILQLKKAKYSNKIFFKYFSLFLHLKY